MNDPGLDRDTAERMLRGEPTGPPRLAALLAAASSEPPAEELDGEQAALAAFRRARTLPPTQPHWRRLAGLGSKAAMTGLLLILAGGAAVAATAQHLPGPFGNRHSHHAPTPTISDTLRTRTSPRTSSHRAPDQHAEPRKQTTPAAHPAHPGHSPSATHGENQPHPTKKTKAKPSNSNPHKPATGAARGAAAPTSGAGGRSGAPRPAGESLE
ncbi:MAG: hypothetical protein JWP48_7403 [Actinoallomurus sp.]|nr:hypothetical protein [Actinoallomurus sp.]